MNDAMCFELADFVVALATVVREVKESLVPDSSFDELSRNELY